MTYSINTIDVLKEEFRHEDANFPTGVERYRNARRRN